MKEHPQDFHLRVELVMHAFNGMAEHCPHRSGDDPDCYHPDIDIDCMVCAPCNCPLFIDFDPRLMDDGEKLPDTDLECFRHEDPDL